ncbi:MAG TPA: aldose epimerase family protein [Flavobacterium sp.]|jgi:aldose 1-epimerase|nr:aldose epimerase family protein [Flavobacterium sp.]
MQNQRKIFGKLPDGREIGSYGLTNSNGMTMRVLEYGCIIQSLKLPINGDLIDIVLGFDRIGDYVESHKLPAPPHFGAVIGRYAGRIKNGRFSIGESHYKLNANNGPNTLHGGPVGWDKVVWDVADKADTSITFKYLSADGDENFPGNLDVTAKYTLTEDNELAIEYSATTDADSIINMTQHTYFNLDGHTGNVLQQQLTVHSNKMLETDDAIVPTGRIVDAASLGFDFIEPRNCPSNIDHSYIIDKPSAPAASLKSLNNGLKLTIYSDQPSVHLYIGGDLFGKLRGKEGFEYHAHSGICFESQNFPDAPNNSHFPTAILRRGETYSQKTIWKFEHEK